MDAGALDFVHFSLYDTLYAAGAIGAVAVTGILYHSLYASDPGWVLPGGKAEVRDPHLIFETLFLGERENS